MNTYERLERFLKGKNRRKYAHETWVERESPDCIAVRYHSTDVVRAISNGQCILNTGGWYTVTTKRRMNDITGLNIFQRKFKWFVGPLEFYNGMVVNA